jgi:hypothetical protein
MPVPAGLTGIFNSAAAGQTVQTVADLNPLPPAAPDYAVLWNPDGSMLDLTPDGFAGSWANGTDGSRQFGLVYSTGSNGAQLRTPVVWSGSASSATILPLGGFSEAEVQGSGGGKFVGTGIAASGPVSRALLWNSPSAAPVDLNPTKLVGFTRSSANDTSGTQQIGSGRWTTLGGGMHDHALLWSGSADSAVDLHPSHLPDINESIGLGTDGRQQVGIGQLTPVHPPHALLWSGSAESAVDLHPQGFDYRDSYAYAVRSGIQVGVGLRFAGSGEALLWRGTAESVVNLHAFLPDGFAWSKATAIDDAGHVFGVAFNIAEQQWHAVEWVPIPEPSSLGLLLPLAAAALLRRRRGSGREVTR